MPSAAIVPPEEAGYERPCNAPVGIDALEGTDFGTGALIASFRPHACILTLVFVVSRPSSATPSLRGHGCKV